MTNREKINRMSNKELAQEISNRVVCTIGAHTCPACGVCEMKSGTNCKEVVKKWLEMEIENG